MVGGGELAELGDGGGDDLEGEVDVGLCGVAAEAKAQAGAGVFRGQADGGEDVRGFDGAGGAGGAGGTSKTLEVESDEERFAFNAGENEIRGVRSTPSAGRIDARMGNTM